MKRKGLSKKLRFSVFERDGFTCRYCGHTPPDVLLEVDHIEPVSKGGLNNESNLVTSCVNCNRGKSARQLGELPEGMDLRMAQDLLEQEALAKLTRRVSEETQQARQDMVNAFCNIFGIESVLRSDVSCLVNLSKEFSPAIVIDWLTQVSARKIDHQNATRYVCGIARNVRGGKR
jgi:hypothetical protein